MTPTTPPIMPALTIPYDTRDQSTPTSAHSSRSPGEPPGDSRRPSVSSEQDPPERPPVSPITPVASIARLAPIKRDEPDRPVGPPPAATFMRHPPLVPISESENPDAIALRSAISLLQLQREKSTRDIKTLEELKRNAVADPEGFIRAIQTQRAHPSKLASDVLSPTLPDGFDNGPTGIKREGSGAQDELKDGLEGSSTKFPPVPQPQNVVRCPPINWAKYHVVGESLDKLHEEQRRYPSSGDSTSGIRAPEHRIAAPYSPFADRVGDPPPQPRKSSKNPPP